MEFRTALNHEYRQINRLKLFSNYLIYMSFFVVYCSKNRISIEIVGGHLNKDLEEWTEITAKLEEQIDSEDR